MRKFLAVLIILLLVIPLMTAALFVVPLRTWMLDRSFYTKALSGEQLSKVLQSSPVFPVQLELPIQLSQETMDALYGVIKQTFTAQYLDSQVQPLVDSLLNLVEGKTSSLQLRLDLKPIKADLLGEKRDQILSILTASIPVCAAGQTATQSGAQVCRPASVSVESFTQTFVAPALTQVVDSLPDEYDLQTVSGFSLDRLYFWQSALPGMSVPNALTLLVVLIGLLAFLFWLISALVADDKWGVRLQWLGAALLVPAVIVLLAAVIVQWLNPGAAINFGLVQFGQIGLAPELKSALTGLLQSLASSVARPFFLSGGIALATALVLLVLGGALKPRPGKDAIEE
jgi:hypothetical protein